MTKVVFPSFSRNDDVSPYDMRQLVSALELRFQALEIATQPSTLPSTDVTEGDFAPIDHTHVEADITDLGTYLTDITGESIFDLSDVTSGASVNDVLIWNGSSFVPGPQSGGGGATVLNDLLDVGIPTVIDNDILQYNVGTAQWEVARLTLGGSDDVDLTGATANDMLYYDGANWIDTAGRLTWDGSTFRIFDATLADAMAVSHDGANVQIDFSTGTTNTVEFANLTSGVNLRDGAWLRYASPTDTETVTFLMDSGNIFRTLAAGGTAEWHIQDGLDVRIYDSTDTDYVSLQHDGADFNTVFSGTTNWDISGLTGDMIVNAQDVNIKGSTGNTRLFVGGPTSDGKLVLIGENAGTVYGLEWHQASAQTRIAGSTEGAATAPATELQFNNLAITYQGGNAVNIRDGAVLRHRDSTDLLYATFSHDAADYNTVFTGTTDWNINGLAGGVILGPDETQPWLTLNPISTGDNWTNQGAGISLSEAGAKGLGLHMTYRGDGTAWIGSGTVDDTAGTGGEPSQARIQFSQANDLLRLYGGVEIRDGPTTGYWRFYGPSGTNYVTADHDNTTWSFTGTSTADFDILGFTGEMFVDTDLRVSGDLTISGTTTTINSNTVSIADNIILLNSDETGAPTQDAGLEVERGTSANVFLQYDETGDRWEFTNDGSTYYNIPTGAEDFDLTGAADNDLLFRSGGSWVDTAGLLTWDGVDTLTISEGTTPVTFENTGVNFTMDATGITNFYFANASAYTMVGGANFTMRDGGLMVANNATNDGAIYFRALATTANITTTGVSTPDLRFEGMDNVSTRSGAVFRIFETGNVDRAEFSHDGTDFNAVFDGGTSVTTDWNITGLTGGLNLNDLQLIRPEILDYGVTHQTPTVSLNAVEVDLELGNSALIDMDPATADVALTLSNPPATGTYGEVTLYIVMGTPAYDITWPGSVTWQGGGNPPELTTTNNVVDLVHLSTVDGGITWYGTYALNAASLALPDGTVTDSTLRWSGTEWIEETDVRISATGDLTLFNGGDVTIRDAGSLIINDSTDTESMTLSHTGSAYTTTISPVAIWNILGATQTVFNRQENATTELRVGESTVTRGGSQGARVIMYGETTSTIYGGQMELSAQALRFEGAGGNPVTDAVFDLDVELSASRHLLLPQTNEPATPTLAFGDGDTGFYEAIDDQLALSFVGTRRWVFEASALRGVNSGNPTIMNEVASATNPVFTIRGDLDTGVGSNDADELSLIAGATEVMRLTTTGANFQDLQAVRPEILDYAITHQTAVVSLNAVTVNCTLGNSVYIDMDPATADVALTLSNPPTSDYGEVTLFIQMGTPAYDITWPGSVTWMSGGNPPTLTTTNDVVDVVHLMTYNGGTTWYGTFALNAGTEALPNGTVTDSTLRWDGSDWIEETDVRISAAGALTIFNGTDSAAFSHDGTDFNTAFTATTDWNLLDGVTLKVFDSTDADYISMYHDGVNGNMDVNPGAFYFRVGGTLKMLLGASFNYQYNNLMIQDGSYVRIYDSTNNDFAQFSHDGSDFNTAFTATQDWNLTGLRTFYHTSTLDTATGNEDAFRIEYTVNKLTSGDDSGLRFNKTDTSSPGNSYLIRASRNSVDRFTVSDFGDISSGQLTINDSGLTDTAVFSHDGTDFNTAFTSTTDWNVTGIESLILPGAGAAASPTLTFGDGDTGFYESSDDQLRISVAGSARFEVSTAYIRSNITDGGQISYAAASATVPALTFSNDVDTGIGKAADNQLSLIAGATEAMRLTTAGANLQDLQLIRPEILDYGVTHQVLTISTATTPDSATVDCTAGNSAYLDLENAVENIEVFFTNPPASGTYGEIVLYVEQGTTARTITWPGSVTWMGGGTAPTLTTTNNVVDILHFSTTDGGTTWYGTWSLNAGSSTALDDLSDVTLTTPNDAALLLYDTGTSQWRDADMSGDATITDTGALTLSAAAISGKSLVTAVATDMVLLWDATDSSLKRADAGDFIGGVPTYALTGFEIRSSGNTDAENRLIEFTHSDSTVRAQVGHFGGDSLGFRNEINGGSIDIEYRDSGGVLLDLLLGDPDGETTLSADTTLNLNAFGGRRAEFANGVASIYAGANIVKGYFSTQGLEIRADTNADTNVNIVRFAWQDSTDRAFVGFSSTTDFYIQQQITNGSILIKPNGTGDVEIGNFVFDGDGAQGAGQDNYVLTYDHAAGKIGLEAAAGGSQTPWTSDIDGAGFGLDNIDRLEIQASGVATDTATFTHDGTDFNTVFANTADWNVSGLDFYKFDSNTAGGAVWSEATVWKLILDHNANHLWLRDGYALRISDSLDGDYAEFSHDGADFNTALTATTTWNFSGAGFSYNLDNLLEVHQSGGAAADFIHLRDTTDTQDLAFRYDGANFTIRNEAAGAGGEYLQFTANTTNVVAGGNWNWQDNDVQRANLLDYSVEHTAPTVSGNAVTVNCENGNSFLIDMDPATTDVALTLSNPPASGTYGEVNLIIVMGTPAHDITWPGSVTWQNGGSAPTLTTTNDVVDLVHLFTVDGGTTWYGTYALNAGAGVNLDELGDTNITSPADASVLIYDTGTATWRDQVIDQDASITDTGAMTLNTTAISGKTELASGLAGTDELLVNDAGTLKRMDVSVMNAYFNANLNFAPNNDFLRADAADIKTTGDLTFNDNIAARFGTGGDVDIAWDGVDLEITGAAAGQVWNWRDGPIIRIYDSTDVEYLQFTTSASQFNIESTQHIQLTPGSGHDVLIFDSGSQAGLRIYDSGGTDYMRMSHTGTHFQMVGTNTADINVSSLTGNFWIRDGAGLRISDSLDTSYVTVSHDANDLNVAGTGAVDINITGYTAIQAGTVDADFDAVTATSFGGDGSGLTSLTAANISSGNLGSGVLPYVNAVSDSQAYKIPFVNTTGGTAGNYQLRMDSGAAPTYNPATNVLSSITFSQNGNTVLDTSTSFGGDVSGTYNAIVVANDSHTHAFNNLTSKTSGTGNYQTTGDFIADNFEATGLGPNTSPGTDDLYVGGYGIMGDRTGTIYVTNAATGGDITFCTDGVHNVNNRMVIASTGITANVAVIATTDYMRCNDNIEMFLGTSNDFGMRFNGTNAEFFSNVGSFDISITDLDINMQDNTLDRPVIKDYGIESQTPTVTDANITLSYVNGPSFQVDLENWTTNRTIFLPNDAPASGTYGEVIVKVQQDTTASRTITWSRNGGSTTNVNWPGGTAPTMTAAADAIDIYHFSTWDGGSNWYGSVIQDVK